MNFEESKTEIIQLASGLTTLVRMWVPENPPKAIFLGIHGALAHSGDWVTTGLFFKNKDIITIGFDLRYHGLQFQDKKTPIHVNNYDDYIKDIGTVLNFIKSSYPSLPVFIIGHSMGALVTLYYCLKENPSKSEIKGIILSSPWLENSVKVSRILLSISKILNIFIPKLGITPESLTDLLTRDKEITKRHYRDEDNGLRRTKVTVRFGRNSFKAQKWVLDNINHFKELPIFTVIAGNDSIAKSETSIDAIKTIDQNLRELLIYEENYHENFNEPNREEIFQKISDWILQYL